MTKKNLMKILLGIFIILLVLLQYQLWLGDGSYFHAWRLREQLIKEQKTSQTMTERNQVLNAQVQDLKQGHVAIEELARNELGMVKKGETFYQVVTPANTDQPPASK